VSCFVICINNDGNPASLILGKVYRTLPDAVAEARGMLRVIDEDQSELDGYLYPASMFAPIGLPEVAARASVAAGDSARRARWDRQVGGCWEYLRQRIEVHSAGYSDVQ